MPLDVGVGSVSYPQTGENRKRSRLMSELTQYIGGESNDDDQTRAAFCLDEAVRSFNDICWRFNRMTETITLVAATSTYTLTATNVKAPYRVQLIASSGLDTSRIWYVPYQTWLDHFPAASQTASAPQYYLLRNLHETGQITFVPGLGATLTHPSVRFEYFRRIALEAGTDDVLEVPTEVEQAIFEWALWRLMLKTDVKAAGPFEVAARRSRMAVEIAWKDFPDIPVLGVRG